jgi:hypothetical protein
LLLAGISPLEHQERQRELSVIVQDEANQRFLKSELSDRIAFSSWLLRQRGIHSCIHLFLLPESKSLRAQWKVVCILSFHESVSNFGLMQVFGG